MSTQAHVLPRRRLRDVAVVLQIAQRVRDLRLARAVTQEELAAALGVKRASMSRYESGERAITIPMLLAIAAVLEQPVTAFLPGEVPHVENQDGVAEVIATLQARPDLIPSVRDLLTALGEERT